ncbi:hypothetical protein QBC37DRAFT_373796 [Rhypophila decipiens]|uniref:Uncharacterized protein n=1 Tax=Rhypophila decipiens TaxID=261697 RepID=A0AAN6Y7Q6_9PEZI|nr:hypothetical protein QBC37DRAFT_373796 [Rhypophila decipiens]
MTTQASSSMPTATTIPPFYGWEKDYNDDLTTRASASVPTATKPPPVPENERDRPEELTQASSSAPTSAPTAVTAPPSLPPRPLSHVQAPYQPLPPHMIAAERGSRHPEIFPVSNYDPTDVHPHDREQLPFNKKRHTAKLTLSTISLIFSAVVIGLGLAIATWGGTGSTQELHFGLTGTTAGLAIFWIAVDNVVTCLSRGRHRIPPGAHVALHLIIWGMAVASATMLALLAQDGHWYHAQYNGEIARLEAAILGLMIIILVIHFVLFIGACVETHEVNLMAMRNKKTIVRYIQVPIPVDAAGAPLFPGAHPGTAYPQPYPQMAMMNQAVPPGPTPYGRPHFQPHGNGIPPPAQVLLGGYYAPTGPPIDPSANFQPPPGTLLHGYYGPPPAPSSVSARRSSNSGARRHSQHSGSSSRRTGQQNPSPSATPKYV